MRGIWVAVVAVGSTVVFHSPASAEIRVAPPEINVSVTRGEAVTKTLQITADAPTSSLQIIASDLEGMNQSGRLVANQVQIKVPQTTVSQDAVVPIEVGIDGDQWRQSGEFSGFLLVKYNGGQQMVPVTIRVKDRIWLPLMVMGVGVGLGLWLTWYRANGLKRDDLVVQMGQLRTQMRAEAEFQDNGLGQEFRKRIDAHLIEVESALIDREWSIAEAEAFEARKVWRYWRKGREDWVEQLRYQQKLLAEVSPVKDWQVGQDFIAQLGSVKRQVVGDSTAEPFRERLLQLRQQVEQILRAKATIEALSAASEEGIRILPEVERAEWRKQRDRLKTDLTRLSLEGSELLEQTESFQRWQKEVKSFEKELGEAVNEQLQASESVPKSTPMIAERMMRETAAKSKQLPVSPVVHPFEDLKLVNQAQLNLRLFGWVVQSVALVLLVWAGLNNLYSDNPIFGARRSNDYFALLAWGFGAEVTRESVVKTIRGLGASVATPEEP